MRAEALEAARGTELHVPSIGACVELAFECLRLETAVPTAGCQVTLGRDASGGPAKRRGVLKVREPEAV